MYPAKLNLLLVDDERPSCELLHMMLRDHCPEVNQIAEAENVDDARRHLEQQIPDIVFLDVEMPNESGLELLKYINPLKTSVVFVTAYSQYAIPALKAGATDYLLKPVDAEELVAITRKVSQGKVKNQDITSVEQKLIIPHLKGLKIVNTKNTVRLKADNNYTEIYLDDGQKLVVSKPIKDFENKLDSRLFYRVHKSHIINILHFKEYLSDYGVDTAVMTDGSK